MTIQILFVELALGCALLGGIAAFRHSIGERLCLLASVPLAYLLAFWLTKGGIFDGIADKLVAFLGNFGVVGAVFETSTLAGSLLKAMLAACMRPLLMTILFWVLALALRIIVSIILKASGLTKRVRFFKAKKSDPAWRQVVACAIGVFSCLMFAMLSYLPIASLEYVIEPAIDKAEAPAYDGTYVQEITGVIRDNFMPSKGTFYGGMQTATGARAILKGTAKSLSDLKINTDNGSEIALNTSELTRDLICIAVDGAALYEFSCHPTAHTLSDMAPVANMINGISDSTALLQLLIDLAGSSVEGEAAGSMLYLVQENYIKQGVANFQHDLKVVASLVTKVTQDLADVSMKKNVWVPAVIGYLGNETSAQEVVTLLSTMYVYEGTIDTLADVGLDMLCEKLGVSTSKEEYYGSYLDSMQTALNQRGEGSYLGDPVEQFIRHLAQEDMKVSEYELGDPESYTELDLAYLNYERFMPALLRVEQVFTDYFLDDKTLATSYTAKDGTVFAYDKKNEKWSIADGETGLKTSSFAAQLLVEKLNAVLEQDIEQTVTHEDIVGYVAEIDSALPGMGVSATRLADTRAALATLVSADGFDPDVVYRDEILNCYQPGIGMSEEDNRHFASILSTAATFFAEIYGETGSGMVLVTENFELVGQLLDDFKGMKKTERIPEKMLSSITQHRIYGKYFVANDVDVLVENINSGETTYRELFASVQALFNIANQIIPD